VAALGVSPEPRPAGGFEFSLLLRGARAKNVWISKFLVLQIFFFIMLGSVIMLACSACEITFTKRNYSGSQLRKVASKRRCRDCIENTQPAPSSRTSKARNSEKLLIVSNAQQIKDTEYRSTYVDAKEPRAGWCVHLVARSFHFPIIHANLIRP
jgi:hypothetical protein